MVAWQNSSLPDSASEGGRGGRMEGGREGGGREVRKGEERAEKGEGCEGGWRGSGKKRLVLGEGGNIGCPCKKGTCTKTQPTHAKCHTLSNCQEH